MAVKIIKKAETLLKIMLVLVGTLGLVYHVFTALAIAGCYGKAWGYLAILIPAGAELFFTIAQLIEGSYHYPILVATYLVVAGIQFLLWWGKKALKRKLVQEPEAV